MKRDSGMNIRADEKKGFISLLEEKTYAVFDGEKRGKRLPVLCHDLLSTQRKVWADLRRGCDSLRRIREREIACRGFSVRLQHNQERIKNALAGADEAESGERPCFLCLQHLPENQKGVLYRGAYLILCNPRPIFPSHFTLSHVDHRPQSIADKIPTFLRLLAEFGSGWTVFYNGPKCGASAPDHLHFQAAPVGQMPIEKEIREENRFPERRRIGGVEVCRMNRMGREVMMIEGDDPNAVERVFEDLLNSLKKILLLVEEPMINVAGFQRKNKWRLIVFPRRKHRPDAFFKKGESRVVVSPGLIDMGGVLITPMEKDFERLEAGEVEGIYQEVSLESEIVKKAMETLFGLPIRCGGVRKRRKLNAD